MGKDDNDTLEDPATEEADGAPEEAESAEEEAPEEDEGRLRRFARRLLDRRELAEDTKDLLVTLVTTSDKAKSEAVRMAGREVRHYLEGLKLKEDLLDVATNYKLEINASFHLKPIAEALSGDDGDGKS